MVQYVRLPAVENQARVTPQSRAGVETRSEDVGMLTMARQVQQEDERPPDTGLGPAEPNTWRRICDAKERGGGLLVKKELGGGG